jgi:hypothetical protein
MAAPWMRIAPNSQRPSRRKSMRRFVAGLVLWSALATYAGGQAIFGTYTTVPVQGGGAPATLVLQKDPQGRVTGSLSGNGVSYAVLGALQGQDAVGILTGAGMRSFFEAHREGTQLRLIMADVGADGKPDYAKARAVIFTAQGAAAGSGNPLADGGAAEKFTGTFTSTDVTLSLKKEGVGYAGTIRYRGEEYPATARATGETLTGSFKVGSQSYELAIAAAGDGKSVNLATGGTTYLLARGGSGNANPLAAGGAAPATGGAMTRPMTAQDQQLAALLTSSAWCAFSYSGSTTYTGTSGGTTRTSRAVFRADGLVSETSNGETVNSGAAGSAYGSNSGGQQARWKVENAQLMLSADGVQWVPQQLKIERNSNGYPIITTGGKEYMMCK